MISSDMQNLGELAAAARRAAESRVGHSLDAVVFIERYWSGSEAEATHPNGTLIKGRIARATNGGFNGIQITLDTADGYRIVPIANVFVWE